MQCDLRPQTLTATEPAEAPAKVKAAKPNCLIPDMLPAIVRGPVAAYLCGMSAGSWSRHHAAGRVPDPVRIGGCVGWRRQELLDWIAAGCPDRRTWEVLRVPEARRNGRPH